MTVSNSLTVYRTGQRIHLGGLATPCSEVTPFLVKRRTFLTQFGSSSGRLIAGWSKPDNILTEKGEFVIWTLGRGSNGKDVFLALLQNRIRELIASVESCFSIFRMSCQKRLCLSKSGLHYSYVFTFLCGSFLNPNLQNEIVIEKSREIFAAICGQ